MDLHALAFGIATSLWPTNWGHPPPNLRAVTDAWADVVEAEPAPVYGTKEEDVAVGMVNAREESDFSDDAEGDCEDTRTGKAIVVGLELVTGRPITKLEGWTGWGFTHAKDVPAWAICRSHGVWQLASAAGHGDLATQAGAALTVFRVGTGTCPPHPLAWLSGAAHCERGTGMSDRRMKRAKTALAQALSQPVP